MLVFRRQKFLLGMIALTLSLFLSNCGKIGGIAKSLTENGDSGTAPSALSYSWSAMTYTVNTQIATNSVTISGTPTSYSVAPALPAGLAINATTGAITGTPTGNDPLTSYIVTASNSAGSASVTLTITVNANDSGRAFSSGCTMSATRDNHFSILLQNGKVLLGGESYSAGGPQSAELYDPSSGTCTATGSLNVGRGDGGFAVLLSNGKVLAGGGSGAIQSAEIYDPTTGLFTTTGSMVAAREYAKAVLLQNGKVLVIGGRNGGGTALASAELYDSSTGIFSSTGSMVSARGYGASVTFLQSGKVLVAGGNFGAGLTDIRNNAEIYDPNAGTFSSTTNNMASIRQWHMSSLLPNGKVLIAGGQNLASGFGTMLTSADLYDPSNNSFSATGYLGVARRLGSSAWNLGAILLPNGKVLILGSSVDGCNAPLNSTELYDPTAGTFALGPSMSITRNGFATALLPNGKVFISGGRPNSCGYDNGAAVNSTELFQ